jgi:hypothetical protein
MLHLFNEVFIEQEEKLEVSIGSRVIVISSVYNIDMKGNPKCITCVDTLTELLTDITLEQFFRETMALTGKIVIYANDEAFSQIIASWLKSSTNMSEEQYACFVTMYKFRSTTNGNRWFNLFGLLQTAWDSAPEYNFSDVDFLPSYEFLLATAFLNPNFDKKEKLVYLMTKFIKREYEEVILEVRRHIDSLILDRDLQTFLGASEYIANIDVENIKTQLPQLQLYAEPFWTEEIYSQSPRAYHPGSFDLGASKIDISLASPADLSALCEFTEDVIYTFHTATPETENFTRSVIVNQFESRGWPYKNSVAYGLLTHEEYLTALGQILAEKYFLIHVPLDLRESIFVQLIPLFKSLKNTNNLEALQKFTLK